MDYATKNPRFERVTNYIQFVNKNKLEEEMKQVSRLSRRDSMLSNVAKMKKLNP